MQALTIREWTLSEFSAGQEQWQTLLKQSGADPLFMSWQWHHQWWQLYALENGFELQLLACYEDEQLVGIAPLYSHKASLPKLNFIPYRQLEFIGTRYQNSLGIRAEYQSFICLDNRLDIHQTLWQHVLCELKWHAVFLPDMEEQGNCHLALKQLTHIKRLLHRLDSNQVTYSIDTSEASSFSDYVQALGKNSRLKLFNRRKLLAQKGEIKKQDAQIEDLPSLVKQLNFWHQKRWGSDCFNPQMVTFITSLIQLSVSKASSASLLYLDDELISTTLNLQYGSRIYNIQLGFIEDFDKKISLGTLHLGYAIEAAFKDPNIDCFDLLAGEGKNDNYKERIAQADTQLISTQVIRSTWLKCIYAAYDCIQKLRR